MKNGKYIVLGIESSCDDTSAAVTAEGRQLLSLSTASQIEIHTLYGGVVPEIASRNHLININTVIQEAVDQAGIGFDEIDLIGVTCGPGLIGALLVGVSAAKALAFALDCPIIGVHHLQGHIAANYIQSPELEPPFTAVVASGGNTDIIDVRGYNDLEMLGQTRDDAAGEAMDKVARVMGIGYPGGPVIDRLAKEGDPNAIEFKRVMLEEGSLDFSFSGTKTGVINYLHTEEQHGRPVFVPDVAASFQEAVLEVVVEKTMAAAKRVGEKRLLLAGGVAANSRLREMLTEACEAEGMTLTIPPPLLCTDNGAMIACAAYRQYLEQGADGLSLDAFANRELAGEKVRAPGRRPKHR